MKGEGAARRAEGVGGGRFRGAVEKEGARDGEREETTQDACVAR